MHNPKLEILGCDWRRGQAAWGAAAWAGDVGRGGAGRRDVACGDVWVLGIRRRNLLETFSNFYHSLHMRSHDTSTSFVNFGLRLHFL